MHIMVGLATILEGFSMHIWQTLYNFFSVAALCVAALSFLVVMLNLTWGVLAAASRGTHDDLVGAYYLGTYGFVSLVIMAGYLYLQSEGFHFWALLMFFVFLLWSSIRNMTAQGLRNEAAVLGNG